MATETVTVCDACGKVVRRVGKDFVKLPYKWEGEPDLHSMKREREVRWRDMCLSCFFGTEENRIEGVS